MRRRKSLAALVAVVLFFGGAGVGSAGDLTWNNGAANFLWDTTSANWTGLVWNNANNDGAIFAATGIGNVNVSVPITARSIDFRNSGYTLSGVGPLTLTTAGTSQL